MLHKLEVLGKRELKYILILRQNVPKMSQNDKNVR